MGHQDPAIWRNIEHAKHSGKVCDQMLAPRAVHGVQRICHSERRGGEYDLVAEGRPCKATNVTQPKPRERFLIALPVNRSNGAGTADWFLKESDQIAIW